YNTSGSSIVGLAVGTATLTSGAGYQAPVVSFADPLGTHTVANTATGVVYGAVTGIAIGAGGSGYTSAPTVYFTGGAGSGATGVAVLSGGAVVGVTITNSGNGYTSAPTVT